jgi:hypothetical protein
MIIRGATKGLGLGKYNPDRSDMFRDTFYPGFGYIDLEAGVGRTQKGVLLPDWDIGAAFGDFKTELLKTVGAALPADVKGAPAAALSKLDDIKLALKVSTGASLLAAGLAALLYFGGRRS